MSRDQRKRRRGEEDTREEDEVKRRRLNETHDDRNTMLRENKALRERRPEEPSEAQSEETQHENQKEDEAHQEEELGEEPEEYSEEESERDSEELEEEQLDEAEESPPPAEPKPAAATAIEELNQDAEKRQDFLAHLAVVDTSGQGRVVWLPGRQYHWVSGQPLSFLDATYKIVGRFDLDNYLGEDIGFISVEQAAPDVLTRLLVDRSGLVYPGKNVVVGIVQFSARRSEVKEDGTKTSLATLHVIAVHPSYRSLGVLGCILLRSSEEILIEQAKLDGSAKLQISVSAIFPDLTNDSAYHFYRRNGYRPVALVLGNIVMRKTILLPDATPRRLRSSLDYGDTCSGDYARYELEHEKASRELEELLRPTSSNVANAYRSAREANTYRQRRTNRLSAARRRFPELEAVAV